MTSTLITVALKLGKLLPLLASDTPGEVVATAAAITRTLKQAGADWHDLSAVLTRAEPLAASAPQPPQPASAWGAGTVGHRIDAEQLLAIIEAIRRSGTWLSPNAKGFLSDLECRATAYPDVCLSDRQHAWLVGLASQAAARTPS